jgi:hypothetical protein
VRKLPTPEQYSSWDAYDLLDAAAAGYLPIDRRLLHALVDEPARTLDAIVRYANEEHEEPELDIEFDLICLFAYLPSPGALPFLIRQVREHAEETPAELAEAIVAIGAPAIEPLLALAEEAGSPGGEADFLLASLGVRDQRVLDRFLRLLADELGDVAFLLGVYGDPAARPALEDALVSHPEEEDAIRAALSSLSDSTVPRREDAPFKLFEQYPEIDEPGWRYLPESERVEYLRSGAPIHRIWAARSFIEDDYSEDAMEALLATAASAPETDLRAACWQALGSVVGEDRVAKAMLARMRNGEEVPLLEQASLSAALAPQHGDDKMVRAAIDRSYATPETRALALEAMWPTLDTNYAKFFERHLDDEDPAIRRQAIIGSGYLRIITAAPRLKPLLLDPDWREDALFAYPLTAPGTTDKPGIRRLLEQVRKAADGLEEHEEEIVKQALDTRLMLNGKPALFYTDEED